MKNPEFDDVVEYLQTQRRWTTINRALTHYQDCANADAAALFEPALIQFELAVREFLIDLGLEI